MCVCVRGYIEDNKCVYGIAYEYEERVKFKTSRHQRVKFQRFFANTEEWLKETGYVWSHVLSEINKMGVTITDDHE